MQNYRYAVGALLVEDPPQEDCAPAWQVVQINRAAARHQFNRGIYQVGKTPPSVPQKSLHFANPSRRASAKLRPSQT